MPIINKPQTIWFDLGTPKQVMFFEPIITEIKKKFNILITSRGDDSYTEVNALLDRKGLEYHSFGTHGGKDLKSKLDSALYRQNCLNEFIQNYAIDRLVSLSSIDGSRVAFGNGIKIVSFNDFPTGKDDKITHAAKLSLPLADKIFYPFYIPKDIFSKYCDNIVEYDFLDPVIYLQNQVIDKTFFNSLSINKNKKTILFREEEYKAAYVDEKTSFAHKILKSIKYNLIIIPRYEAELLKKEFPEAIIIEEKIELSNLLPYVDLFIGGGGTINIEAVYWNTPVISTRSFLCFYDRYLVDKGYLSWATTEEELKYLIEKNIGMSFSNNIKRKIDIKTLCKQIIKE